MKKIVHFMVYSSVFITTVISSLSRADILLYSGVHHTNETQNSYRSAKFYYTIGTTRDCDYYLDKMNVRTQEINLSEGVHELYVWQEETRPRIINCNMPLLVQSAGGFDYEIKLVYDNGNLFVEGNDMLEFEVEKENNIPKLVISRMIESIKEYTVRQPNKISGIIEVLSDGKLISCINRNNELLCNVPSTVNTSNCSLKISEFVYPAIVNNINKTISLEHREFIFFDFNHSIDEINYFYHKQGIRDLIINPNLEYHVFFCYYDRDGRLHLKQTYYDVDKNTTGSQSEDNKIGFK